MIGATSRTELKQIFNRLRAQLKDDESKNNKPDKRTIRAHPRSRVLALYPAYVRQP